MGLGTPLVLGWGGGGGGNKLVKLVHMHNAVHNACCKKLVF